MIKKTSIIFLVIGLLAGLSLQPPQKTVENSVYYSVDCQECNQEDDFQEIVKLFEKQQQVYHEHGSFYDARVKISQREYTDNYKCLDFSKDLVSELEKIGIKSELIIGDLNGQRHAWVEVWIEPISGKFIGIDEDYINN